MNALRDLTTYIPLLDALFAYLQSTDSHLSEQQALSAAIDAWISGNRSDPLTRWPASTIDAAPAMPTCVPDCQRPDQPLQPTQPTQPTHMVLQPTQPPQSTQPPRPDQPLQPLQPTHMVLQPTPPQPQPPQSTHIVLQPQPPQPSELPPPLPPSQLPPSQLPPSSPPSQLPPSSPPSQPPSCAPLAKPSLQPQPSQPSQPPHLPKLPKLPQASLQPTLQPSPLSPQRQPADAVAQPELGLGYQWKCLFLPDGTRLRMIHEGKSYQACVVGNHIMYQGHPVSPNRLIVAIAGPGRNAWRDLSIRLPDDLRWQSAALRRFRIRQAEARPQPTAAESIAAAAASMEQALQTVLTLVDRVKRQLVDQPERRIERHRRSSDQMADWCAAD